MTTSRHPARVLGMRAFARLMGWPWAEFLELLISDLFWLVRLYGVRLVLADTHRPKRWPDVLLYEGWPDTWPRRSNA